MLRYRAFDFSENNLKDLHGFDWGPCDGGNEWISVAYMARRSGPVLEADDPYHPSIDTAIYGLPGVKNIQDVHMLPGKGSALDNNNLKQALLMYGALDTAYLHDDGYYNSTNATYNYQGSYSGSNHEVTLVGWDDNFSPALFSPTAPGPGAYIVKNSWGTSWGQSGYFYVSYYDKNFAYFGVNSFVDGESNDNYSNVYQYDPYGWVSSWGFNSETAWFANIFQSSDNETLAAVSFYTAAPNATYVVDVYTDVGTTPTSGVFIGRTSGSIATPGYHTVKLPNQVRLSPGQKFAVAVKLITPGWGFPIPTEDRVVGYNSNATAAYGQSFLSSDGANWSDFQDFNPDGNAALKVFTKHTPDLLWRNTNNGNFSMWRMGGSNGAVLQSAFPIFSALPLNFVYVGAGDFDGNGSLDYVWHNTANGNIGIWYMNNAITIASTQTLLAGAASFLRFVDVADFDGDGHPDILFYDQNAGYAVVSYMGGPRSAVLQATYVIGPAVDPTKFSLEGAADIDGDGKQDLLWRNLTNGNVGIWKLGETPESDGRWLYPRWTGTLLWGVPASYNLGGIADFDGDGKKDIAWLDTSSGKVEIWYLGGPEGSTVQGMYPVFSGLAPNFRLVGARVR